MKHKLLKRGLCILVAAAMSLTMAGCAKKEAIPIATKDNIFESQDIPLPEKFDYVNTMSCVNDRIYIVGQQSREEGTGDNINYISTTKLCVCNVDGSLINGVELSVSDNTSTASRSVNKMSVAADGSVTMLINEYSWDEVTYESTNKYFIAQYDKDGNFVSEKDISDLLSNSQDEYIQSMISDDSGNFYFLGNNVIYVADSSGKLLFKLEENTGSGEESGSYINGLYKTGDGRIVSVVNSYSMTDGKYKNSNTIKTIDFAAKAYGAEYPVNSNSTSFFDGSSDYDLYISLENTMCGYDIETGETTTVIDWLKSGFDTTTLNGSTILPDGRIMCSTYKYDNEGGGYSWGSDMIISILSRVDPTTIPDKQVISLYAWYLDYNVRQKIADYNKTNEKYMIEVTSYGDYADASGDYTAGLTKLNNDLIAGKIPDILMLNSEMPFDSYVAKGMIADLSPFFESDEEIKKEDYLPNILEAFSSDGKLYEIAPAFSIQTVVGKTTDVGADYGWTVDEYSALAQANADKQMFSEMTKTNFLYQALSLSASQYINKTTGECTFNSDGFKKLLEIANSFPDETPEYDESYDYNASQMAYRNGTTLLSFQYIYYFNSIKELEQGQFGEPITFVGFPCSDGTGSVISPNFEFSIMSSGKNKEGAWDFIKLFLKDDYQNELSYCFPLKLSAYDQIMAKAKEKPYYMDENNNKVEYDNQYWCGDKQFTLDVNSDADNEKMMSFIKSINQLGRIDTSLLNIITEEAAAYFAGQKSVDEVADIIQNRASIYVSEGR